MERRLRNMLVQKENDHKNVNKKDHDFDKIDRLLKIKKMNNLEENREIRGLKNSKDIRAVSKSLVEKTPKIELKPLSEALNNTQIYCQLYAHDILQRSLQDHQSLGSFLTPHDIDKGLRARMLDWMIEVTASYKFSPKTYFSGVHLMDRYFKAEDQRLPITKLHITGVVSMLIATKMDEVYPLKVKTVYDKIVHKKIDKREIMDMEARIAHKLGFVLNVWSFYDLALLKLHENWQVKNQEAIKEIEELCHLIGKFVVFNYQLYGHYSVNILAEALLRAACRVYGNEKAKLAMGERQNFQTNRDYHACLELMLDTVRNFKSGNRTLNNIFKFSNESAMMKLQEHIKHC